MKFKEKRRIKLCQDQAVDQEVAEAHVEAEASEEDTEVADRTEDLTEDLMGDPEDLMDLTDLITDPLAEDFTVAGAGVPDTTEAVVSEECSPFF